VRFPELSASTWLRRPSVRWARVCCSWTGVQRVNEEVGRRERVERWRALPDTSHRGRVWEPFEGSHYDGVTPARAVRERDLTRAKHRSAESRKRCLSGLSTTG